MANSKPKARGVPAKTVPPPPDERPQRERFIEAAREAGVTDEAFEKGLTKVARHKPPERSL